MIFVLTTFCLSVLIQRYQSIYLGSFSFKEVNGNQNLTYIWGAQMQEPIQKFYSAYQDDGEVIFLNEKADADIIELQDLFNQQKKGKILNKTEQNSFERLSKEFYFTPLMFSADKTFKIILPNKCYKYSNIKTKIEQFCCELGKEDLEYYKKEDRYLIIRIKNQSQIQGLEKTDQYIYFIQDTSLDILQFEKKLTTQQIDQKLDEILKVLSSQNGSISSDMKNKNYISIPQIFLQYNWKYNRATNQKFIYSLNGVNKYFNIEDMWESINLNILTQSDKLSINEEDILNFSLKAIFVIITNEYQENKKITPQVMLYINNDFPYKIKEL